MVSMALVAATEVVFDVGLMEVIVVNVNDWIAYILPLVFLTIGTCQCDQICKKMTRSFQKLLTIEPQQGDQIGRIFALYVGTF
jgi:positive regulator of sigma E activity